MQIEMNEEQAGCLEEYAEKTGRPTRECLFEALDDWIRTVAASVSQSQKSNVIMFPSGPLVMMEPEVA